MILNLQHKLRRISGSSLERGEGLKWDVAATACKAAVHGPGPKAVQCPRGKTA